MMSKNPAPILLIDRQGAASALGISVSVFEKLVRTKRLPPSRQISEGRVGWLWSELAQAAHALPVSDGLPPRDGGHGRRGKARPCAPAPAPAPAHADETNPG